MVFVQILCPNEPPRLLALLHCYCCPENNGNGHLIYDVDDEKCLVNHNRPELSVRLQRVAMAYVSENPVFELVDTEALSTGVWVQQDFDCSNLFWFIRKFC